MKLNSLINKNKKNKKAAIADLFLWLSISFVVLIFFAVWLFGMTQIDDTLQTMTKNLTAQNDSIASISKPIFGEVLSTERTMLPILALAIIFFTGLSIPLTLFVQKSHPAFFIVYLLIIVTAFMMSVYISNQYEELLGDDLLGPTLQTFTGSNFIMLSLPIWTAVLGFTGAIFLFSGILRDSGAGGGVG